MRNTPALQITIASDVDYDKLIAEIYCDDRFVALISQEDGSNNLVLEFPETAPGVPVCRSVDLRWFMDAIGQAVQRLPKG